ncbi:CopG family transcriptional regulator, partial [Corynebacterium casei]
MAMTLRLTPEQDHALTLLASAHGTSKHEAVVRAIALAAARTVQDTTVDELARQHIKGRSALEADIRRSRS